MTFKLGEVVFITSLGGPLAVMNGLQCTIKGREGRYPVTCYVTGKVGTLTGYPVQIVGQKGLQVVMGECLRRGRLERGDMDTPVTWTEFSTATGISEDKIKGTNRDY